MRAFPVALPTGQRYWTVLDDELQVVAEAEDYLRHLRFGQARSEGTTEAYARSLALYFTWCRQLDLDWWSGARRLTSFMFWLQHSGSRSPGRVNAIAAAIRELCKHAVASGWTSPSLLSALYAAGDDRWLPPEARGEAVVPRGMATPRHRLPEPARVVNRASAEQVVALLGACRSARDRFIVVALARGLRRGEIVSLRRQDIHFVLDATSLGCNVEGAHLHVIRRDTSARGGYAKSRRPRVAPADALLVQAWDAYWWERAACRQAADNDFVLVNLFRAPIGAAMRPGAVNELFESLSQRAGLAQAVHPHMLRHAFASDVLDSGGSIDEVQELLGHASSRSTQPYLHPAPGRMREAVERVASFRTKE